MKKDEEIIEPELHITDDMPDVEAVPEVEKEATTVPMTEEEIVEQEPATPTAVGTTTSGKPSAGNKFKDFLKTKKGKVIVIVAALLLVIGAILAIPFTRYAVLGVFVKKEVTITVLDQSSKKPVSGAIVTVGTNLATTDAKGIAKLPSVSVGEYTLNVEKKYYEPASQDYTVPVLAAPEDVRPELKATGRSIEITVTNKVTGGPVKDAAVTVSDSTAATDEKGIASIMLPVKSEPQKGTVKSDGCNDASFEVKVENKDAQKVEVPLTPAGTIYFLSKRSGKVDVMKSNLDGTNAQVVVAGTGQENDSTTVLLASTDWKYLALQASRDSELPKLYLIDTSNGKLSVIDEGNADFQLTGWSGHSFVFQANRRTTNFWDNKRAAIKVFNAESGKLTTLDETEGGGTSYSDYAYQSLANVFAIDGNVIYTKSWDLGASVSAGDRKSSIMSVSVSGSGKKSLKDFPVTETAYFESKLYKPAEVYFRVVARADSKATYYEYEDGAVGETGDTNDAKFYNNFYTTYLYSPSGNKTMWYEPRDGKNVIFIGDKSGANGREVGVGEFTPYGWYGDDYVLMSKKGSELYAFGSTGTFSETTQPQKITDYHKAQLSYPGYGGGYGGL